jgi:hypothetical protein
LLTNLLIKYFVEITLIEGYFNFKNLFKIF